MERKPLIQQLEKARGSKVITYLTSDRQGPFNARIATDVIPLMSRELQAVHAAEEDRPIETLWDAATAVTAFAKTIKYQDERVALEKIGGDIIDLAA